MRDFRFPKTLLVTGVFIVLVVLQWIPFTGIFLMFLAAPVWVGLFPHFIMIAFVYDVLKQNHRKVLLLVPVALYGGYFGWYVSDVAYIRKIESELREANPSDILAYDLEAHDLVGPAGLEVYFQIPVLFEPSEQYPHGYQSWRIVSHDYCKREKDFGEDARQLSVMWTGQKKRTAKGNRPFDHICRLRMPEKPSKTQLRIEETEIDDRYRSSLHRTKYEVYLGEDKQGEYIAGYYSGLRAFPFFIIGCMLDSSRPSWACDASLVRRRVKLDVYPEDGAKDVLKDRGVHALLSRLLSLQPYDEAELTSFKDYPANVAKLDSVLARGASLRPEDLDRWGLAPDSPYHLSVGKIDGYPSISGKVFQGKKGGSFYDFMREHAGEVVYLDIYARVNANTRSFGNWGVCYEGRENCSNATTDYYHFKKEDGSHYNFETRGRFEGFFLVGEQIVVGTAEDGFDTRTELREVRP